LAQIAEVPFLGRIPLDPRLGQCSEKGQSCLQTMKDSPVSIAVDGVIKKLLEIVDKK